MERLDQGHLHPRSDMSRPGIDPGPRWEASTLEKSHSNSFLIAIRNIYILARDQWRMLATILLQIIRIRSRFQDAN